MGRDVHIYGQEEAVRMASDQQQNLINERRFELDVMGARTNSLADIADSLSHIAKYGIICYHIHLTTDSPKVAFDMGRSIQLQNITNPLTEDDLNPEPPK